MLSKDTKKLMAKILVVDDDKTAQIALKMMFQQLAKVSQYQFHIKFVSTGMKAVHLTSTWQPEIMILDVHLPDITAHQVLKQLDHNKALEKTLVLLMTSDTSEETALMGLSSGARDIIYKPIRPTELSLKLANLLDFTSKELKIREAYNRVESEKKIMSKFFSQDIMEKILNDKELSGLGGINTFASTLFLDIRGSTLIAESMEPKKFAELLNLVFDDFSSIIHRNYGSVNKFLGDGILATYGCPVVYGNDTYNAVKTAVELRQAVHDFNAIRPSFVKEEIDVGIGISSGKVFAGTVGSSERMEYTVLGDPVNISSRLDSLGKDTPYTIIIDGATRETLGNILVVEKLDFNHVRGRIGELDIYALKDINKDEAAKSLEADAPIANLEEIGEVEFF